MPNLIQYDKIHYYKNVIDEPNEIIRLIELTDKELTEESSITKWSEWAASGEPPYIFGYQKRINNNIDSNQDVSFIRETLESAIINTSNEYAKFYNMDIGQLMPISISKYLIGKSMGPHVDDYENGENPNISVVLYLNDDYEGGELYFKEQDIRIKPEPGSIVIFPSVKPYYHESLPILSGVKYMSPGFWRKINRMV